MVAQSEAPNGGSGEAGTGGETDMQGVARKVDEWRRYFRDRGLSAGDIPKALVVHEVRRARQARWCGVVGGPCFAARRRPLSACGRFWCAQVIGLAWFATSWAVCYSVQPCRALSSRFFATRSEQFFAAAQRYATARQQSVRVVGGVLAALPLRQICSAVRAASTVPSHVGLPPRAALCDAAAVEGPALRCSICPHSPCAGG